MSKVKSGLVFIIYVMATPILTVLYVGLFISMIFAVVAAVLRTVGMDMIKMNIWYEQPIPVALSIPAAVLFSLLLLYCLKYIKRALKYSLTKIKW
ncbi:hypothetical protein ACQKCU_00585 [Heyndrickxia sporothermodurans]